MEKDNQFKIFENCIQSLSRDHPSEKASSVRSDTSNLLPLIKKLNQSSSTLKSKSIRDRVDQIKEITRKIVETVNQKGKGASTDQRKKLAEWMNHKTKQVKLLAEIALKKARNEESQEEENELQGAMMFDHLDELDESEEGNGNIRKERVAQEIMKIFNSMKTEQRFLERLSNDGGQQDETIGVEFSENSSEANRKAKAAKDNSKEAKRKSRGGERDNGSSQQNFSEFGDLEKFSQISQQEANQLNMAQVHQLVMLHERRMSEMEERIEGMSQMISVILDRGEERISQSPGSYGVRPNYRLERRIEELEASLERLENKQREDSLVKEEQVVGLVRRSVDKQILNLIDVGIIGSGGPSVVGSQEDPRIQRFEDLAKKVSKKKHYAEFSYQITEDMVQRAANDLNAQTIDQINFAVEHWHRVYKSNKLHFEEYSGESDGISSGLTDPDEANSEFDQEVAPVSNREELEDEEEETVFDTGGEPSIGRRNSLDLRDLIYIFDHEEKPDLDDEIFPVLMQEVIEYEEAIHRLFEEEYRALDNFRKNLINSKYHNIFYSLDNLKIQVSIKSPNFAQNNFCDDEGCIIATADKVDWLAVQNWRGLAIIKNGKIVSDFVSDRDKGPGWKDVVFLEKGAVFKTFTSTTRTNQTGSGMGFGIKNSRKARNQRLSNRSVGGSMMRKERLSNQSLGGGGGGGRTNRRSNRRQRRERKSNMSIASIGGVPGKNRRQERLSYTVGGRKYTTARGIDGLSVGSVGDLGGFNKKGFYYIYKHSLKFQDGNRGGVYRRDLSANGQPEWFVNFSGSPFPGRSLRVGLNEYGGKNHLIMNKEHKHLVYLDVETLKMFDINPLYGEDQAKMKIFDYQCLSDNRVLIMNKEGLLLLLKYFPANRKTVYFCHFELELRENEYCYSLAVCPKSKVVCVNISADEERLSRLVVLEVDGDYLHLVDVMDLYSEGHIDQISAMEFYDYFQEKLVLTALTGKDPLTMFGFMYDGTKLMEFVQRKVLSDLSRTYRISRIEDGAEGLMTADTNWNLIKIKYVC